MPTFPVKKECFQYKLTCLKQAAALNKQFSSFPCVLALEKFDCTDIRRLLIKNFCKLYDVMDICM